MISGNNQKLELLRKHKPSLYDYFYENNLDWPCITCKWGTVIADHQDYMKQKVYFACRTDGIYYEQENLWKKIPSFLVVANIEFPKTGRQFNQELNYIYLQSQYKKCPYIQVKQIIVHPGDPSIMKASHLSSGWIATKSDNTEVYIWNLDKHKYVPNLDVKENSHADVPDLTLLGHTQMSSFALDWAKTSHRVASGGNDKKVLIWDLEDYQTRLSTSYMLSGKRELNQISGGDNNMKLNQKQELSGHNSAVEDISFSPKDRDILVSVGDDRKVIGWDLRVNGQYTFKIDDIHQDDINTVDWNILDENYIITGSADGTAKIMDLRQQKVVQSISKISYSKEKTIPIQCVKFSNFDKDLFGVASDNLRFYDMKQYQDSPGLKPKFTHLNPKGHIADFDFNQYDNFNIICTSQDVDENSTGGGLLHTFRPIDLILDDKETAINKLRNSIKINNTK